jgi:hypothetical protein
VELFVTIIFLLLLGSVLLYYSFREINWYFKKEEQKENLCLHVRESFLKRDYQIISMREPNKLEKKENPFRSGVRIVLPAFFGAGERSFYWIVSCKDAHGNGKEVWAEATQSIFMKPKYKFSPNII